MTPRPTDPVLILGALLEAQQENNRILKSFLRQVMFVGVVYLITVGLTACGILINAMGSAR